MKETGEEEAGGAGGDEEAAIPAEVTAAACGGDEFPGELGEPSVSRVEAEARVGGGNGLSACSGEGGSGACAGGASSSHGWAAATTVRPAIQPTGNRTSPANTAAICHPLAPGRRRSRSCPTGARLWGGGSTAPAAFDRVEADGARDRDSARDARSRRRSCATGSGAKDPSLLTMSEVERSWSGSVVRADAAGETDSSSASQAGGGKVVMPTAAMPSLSRRTRGSRSGGMLQALEDCAGRLPAQRSRIFGGKVRRTRSYRRSRQSRPA